MLHHVKQCTSDHIPHLVGTMALAAPWALTALGGSLSWQMVFLLCSGAGTVIGHPSLVTSYRSETSGIVAILNMVHCTAFANTAMSPAAKLPASVTVKALYRIFMVRGNEA